MNHQAVEDVEHHDIPLVCKDLHQLYASPLDRLVGQLCRPFDAAVPGDVVALVVGAVNLLSQGIMNGLRGVLIVGNDDVLTFERLSPALLGRDPMAFAELHKAFHNLGDILSDLPWDEEDDQGYRTDVHLHLTPGFAWASRCDWREFADPDDPEDRMEDSTSVSIKAYRQTTASAHEAMAQVQHLTGQTRMLNLYELPDAYGESFTLVLGS